MSCQTIALCTGLPVVRSHRTVVSRWLVMPSALSCPARNPALASAPATTARTLAQISVASCSTQPGRGKIWRCSRWSTATTAPPRSKMMQRLDVVPWSIAATYFAPRSVMAAPRAGWLEGCGALTLRCPVREEAPGPPQNAALQRSPASAPPISGPTTGTHA
ncbi:hypothetical protein SFUMM280S_01090 [Streptomyces fumanus]